MADHEALERVLVHLADRGAVVLKNPDLWDSVRRGGDWDVFVPDVRRTAGELREILGSDASVVRRSYVTAVHYPGNHVDLLPDIRWRGHVLVSAREIADGARYGPHPLPVARLAHQAFTSCVYPTMAHASFKARYLPIWQGAVLHDDAELSRLMQRTFGVELSAYVDPAKLVSDSHALRRKLLRRDVTGRPILTARSYASFAVAELAIRARR